MQKFIEEFIDTWKSDYEFKTKTVSLVSAIIGIAYTIFNGFLGIYYSSIWNGTICVYYVLLAIVRAIIIRNLKKEEELVPELTIKKRKSVYKITHILLFSFNIVIVVPIAVMIKGEKSYTWGLIPSLAMATYTTYRVVMSIINYIRAKRVDNILIKELRIINILDTLVSILILQNTLIIANSGEISGGMKVLSIVSSTVIWLAMLVVSIVSVNKSGD